MNVPDDFRRAYSPGKNDVEAALGDFLVATRGIDRGADGEVADRGQWADLSDEIPQQGLLVSRHEAPGA